MKKISIRRLIGLIADFLGCKGDIIWDMNKPDGSRRKLMDCSGSISLIGGSNTSLKSALKEAYKAFFSNIEAVEEKQTFIYYKLISISINRLVPSGA